MIDYNLDTVQSVLTVRPKAALEQHDFEQMTKAVDPFIEESGGLCGLIVDAPDFPGWESLAAMVAHFRFVRDHQKKIGKVALVTDSALGNVAEYFASHFVSAQVRHFPGADYEEAKSWVAR